MKSSEALRDIMNKQGIGLTDMARKMGEGKTARLVSDRLRLNNISIDKLSELTSLLGYKIVLVPAGTELPEGCYEIE